MIPQAHHDIWLNVMGTSLEALAVGMVLIDEWVLRQSKPRRRRVLRVWLWRANRCLENVPDGLYSAVAAAAVLLFVLNAILDDVLGSTLMEQVGIWWAFVGVVVVLPGTVLWERSRHDRWVGLRESLLLSITWPVVILAASLAFLTFVARFAFRDLDGAIGVFGGLFGLGVLLQLAAILTPWGPGADSELPPLGGLPVSDFYLEQCARCHGSPRENLSGTLVLADEVYVDIIRFGVPGTLMGATGLNRTEAQLLVDFLRSPLRE